MVLSRFDHLESIPDDPGKLGLPAGRAVKLIDSLRTRRDEALLYRRLATLRTDVPLAEKVADLEWRGAAPGLNEVCAALGDESILTRIPRWRGAHG